MGEIRRIKNVILLISQYNYSLFYINNLLEEFRIFGGTSKKKDKNGKKTERKQSFKP